MMVNEKSIKYKEDIQAMCKVMEEIEDMPQEDEIRIIEEAKKEIDSGNIYTHEEVWT